MEEFRIYHIDAFTDNIFGGNPAAVCILQKWPAESDLLSIAKENNLPVTSFLVRDGTQYQIRWITPDYELDICGHGTLAACYVIFNHLEPLWLKVELQSRTELLHVVRSDDLITLNFPAIPIEKFSSSLLERGLGLKPQELYQQKNERCLAVFGTEEEVKHLKPDRYTLKKLAHRGIIVTAPGKTVDFVSRTFYPQKSIFEDPVTGVSHSLLAPYWAKRLNKTALRCWQISERRGEIFCRCQGQRILMSGKAVLYMEGKVF